MQNRGYATLSRVVDHFDRLVAGGDESNAIVDALDAVNLMTTTPPRASSSPSSSSSTSVSGGGGGGTIIRVVPAPFRDDDEDEPAEASVAIGEHESDADRDADAGSRRKPSACSMSRLRARAIACTSRRRSPARGSCRSAARWAGCFRRLWARSSAPRADRSAPRAGPPACPGQARPARTASAWSRRPAANSASGARHDRHRDGSTTLLRSVERWHDSALPVPAHLIQSSPAKENVRWD